MERLSRFFLAALLAAFVPAIVSTQVWAVNGEGDCIPDPDQDRDRLCDDAQDCEEFVDADGDGLCDLCGRTHEAGRERIRNEKGGPGGCPGFVDEDGDGVCDNCDCANEDPIHQRDRDRDGDPAQDCEGFVDADGDGLCDLCGGDHEAEREREREQEQNQDCEGFVDADGDGLCDLCGGDHEAEREREREQEQNRDGCPGFVDEDGDGVCDNCGDHEANGEPARKRFRRGDSNQDGNQDISDVIHTLGALFQHRNQYQLGCPDAADANDDGNVDISDAVAMLRHLFQHRSGASMPPPCQNAGEDPTPDELGCE